MNTDRLTAAAYLGSAEARERLSDPPEAPTQLVELAHDPATGWPPEFLDAETVARIALAAVRAALAAADDPAPELLDVIRASERAIRSADDRQPLLDQLSAMVRRMEALAEAAEEEMEEEEPLDDLHAIVWEMAERAACAHGARAMPIGQSIWRAGELASDQAVWASVRQEVIPWLLGQADPLASG